MSKEGSSNSVNRFDSVRKEWMEKPFERTAEGFLQGRAIVTNIGVFFYKNADGGIQAELRLPEEVFSYDSLETLKMKPVTNNHPTEAVTSSNVADLQVGSLGSNPSSESNEWDWNGNYTPDSKITDGLHVAIDMTVNEETAIIEVLNGKSALSCGYSTDLEKADEGAVWCGVPYDYIQRKIRYNHVAIVDVARAGESAKIRLDSGDAILIETEKKTKEVCSMGEYKELKIDGVSYKAEAQVLAALHQANEKLDSAEAKISAVDADKSKMEAERDSLQERVDSMEVELKEAKEAQLDQSKIDSAVDARLILVQTAKDAGVEKLDGSNVELRDAVIMAAFPKADLEGKDEFYLEARFDSAVEVLGKSQETDATNRKDTALIGKPDVEKVDADAARARMIAQQNKDSRGE